MGDHLLKFKPGQAVTFRATTNLVGGNVVEVTGDRACGVAGAASKKVLGTAGHDAKSGTDVVVHLPGVIDTMVAAGAVAAGDRVTSAAGGKVATGTTDTLGLAIAGAADGGTVQVLRA